jgi:hypothetical protein
MHRGGVFGLTLVTAVLTVFSFGACDLLNNKPEIDVERAIDGAVAYANAAILPVTVDEGGMGTASPRGTLTGIKQGVPFTLNYSSFAEYGFLRWEAVLASAPGTKLNADKVEFDPVDKPETTVTVKINPGADDRVIIRPVGGLAPTVVSFTPDLAVHGIVSPARAIRIRFSRAIDPDSFLFDNGLPFLRDWKAVYYPETSSDYTNRVYKNISIESTKPMKVYSTDGEFSTTNWTSFFDPPELSVGNTVLTLTFRYGQGIGDNGWGRTQLTVTLNRDIKDTSGISLGRTTSFSIEAVDDTNFRRYSPKDEPYPRVLNYACVMVKADSPPDTDYPDGRMLPAGNIFSIGDNTEYNGSNREPSSNPSHHFAYDRDDNWIYLAFQTEPMNSTMDYTFAGALIYEWYFDFSDTTTNGAFANYTGAPASPVYDPDIVRPLIAAFKNEYPEFDSSRPIRVVKYKLAKRTWTGNREVSLHIVPLDVFDRPSDDPYSHTTGGQSDAPFANDPPLFEDDSYGEFTKAGTTDRINASDLGVTVWFTDPPN